MFFVFRTRYVLVFKWSCTDADNFRPEGGMPLIIYTRRAACRWSFTRRVRHAAVHLHAVRLVCKWISLSIDPEQVRRGVVHQSPAPLFRQTRPLINQNIIISAASMFVFPLLEGGGVFRVCPLNKKNKKFLLPLGFGYMDIALSNLSVFPLSVW